MAGHSRQVLVEQYFGGSGKPRVNLKLGGHIGQVLVEQVVLALRSLKILLNSHSKVGAG